MIGRLDLDCAGCNDLIYLSHTISVVEADSLLTSSLILRVIVIDIGIIVLLHLVINFLQNFLLVKHFNSLVLN